MILEYIFFAHASQHTLDLLAFRWKSGCVLLVRGFRVVSVCCVVTGMVFGVTMRPALEPPLFFSSRWTLGRRRYRHPFQSLFSHVVGTLFSRKSPRLILMLKSGSALSLSVDHDSSPAGRVGLAHLVISS